MQEIKNRLNLLAHLLKDCPECGGSGEVPCQCDFPSIPNHMDKCPNCTDGKVFVLPEVVRKRCPCEPPEETPSNSYLSAHCKQCDKACKHSKLCYLCSGLGTVASQDMGDWIEAAQNLGYAIRMFKGGCRLMPGDFEGRDPKVFTALILAIEKAVA